MDKENKNYIYICALEGLESYHYEFICPKCKESYTLATGTGRYGNLGAFSCPNCNTNYHTTIDDHQNPQLYVHYKDEQLSGNRGPILVLKERDNKI